MEFKSFRELLIKKAGDNPTLQTIIHVMKDEIIADHVLEVLEKMARPHASMGRGANAAVTAYANQFKNKDTEMLRDSLAHHVAHHKSALKAGNREVADRHLEKIIPLMHLAGKAASHSNGQLGLDYVNLEPWESNYTTLERRPETGKLKEGTKGLGRRPKNTTRVEDQNHPGVRAVPDYRYLEMQPHSGHPDMANSPHKGGYPFEEIQIGNPAKIDAKEAYLHIPDVPASDKFVSHPFDEHPIHQVADTKQDDLTPEKMQEFSTNMQKWHDTEHNKQWMEKYKSDYAKDPEGFKTRGKTRSQHHFHEIELGEQPPHAKRTISQDGSNNLPKDLKQKFTQPTVPAQQSKPNVDLSSLPPALRAKFGGQ